MSKLAHKGDVVDNYHGTGVADPYRWLEEPDSPETVQWVAEQNEQTNLYIENIPARSHINSRLTQLWNYPRYSAPFKKGQQYFFFKNDGLQNQAIFYRQTALDSEPVVVIDPNKLSEDGTIALTNVVLSEDGNLLAYGVSSSGSDWQEIRIRRVDDGQDYDEVLKWCKFSSIAWKHDQSGFYYNRLPDPSTIPAEEQSYHSKVYWHQLDTPQEQDQLVYERPEAKELSFTPFITEDGKYLGIAVWEGTDPRSRFYYREVASTSEFIRLLDDFDAAYSFIDNDDQLFYFQTDLNASRGRLIAIDLNQPARENWREIIPQAEDVLSFVTTVNQQFVTSYLHDAHDQLKVYNRDGSFDREIALPTLGTVSELQGKREDTEMFVGFTSFLYPTTIFRYDFGSGQFSTFHDSEIDFDPSGYETQQVFYNSKDGTRVPMFLVHKKGLVLNGNNPTFLYAYGGFGINMTPSFAVSRLVWIENGGVYAIANLRGGGEYGEDWHQAGTLERKQNVFDDFQAAAEWLIQHKYTQVSKLAIMGGSNGGLLVAACMVQRPDLFGAVVCQVPVADMLRFHRFTVGRYWTSEYGNAETNSDHFRFLYAYSPLHNVHQGVAYPPTLITTADTDDRVAPLHAKKFAATLQAAQRGSNPILLRVETKAGHGGGKPTAKVIEEQSDVFAFLFKVFGIE